MLDHKIHRVWLTDDDDKPLAVMTCTDVLSLFVQVPDQ